METVYIETYGCTANKADTEEMAGALSKKYALTKDSESADLIILNTCTVKGATERKIIHRLKTLTNKKVLVAGCMAQAQPQMVLEANPKASLIGTYQIAEIEKAVEKIFAGEQVRLTEKTERKRCPERKRIDNVHALISIAQGCKGACTYCIARLARGELQSFQPDAILEEVRDSVEAGAKEIRLTCQDCGVWGEDIGQRLPALVESVLSLPGEFRVRIGMMNPDGVGKFLPELMRLYKDPKLYQFAHLPVQSGSNKVLKAMNRKYTREQFLKICSQLRTEIPDITIATDIIVGYPGETKTDFEETISLLKETRPDIVNISRFTPRPNTPASRLKQTPSEVSKERSRIASALCKKIGIENNKRYAGSTQTVLITENGKNNTLVGRTGSYKPVVLAKGRTGEFVKVKIAGAASTYLIGD